MWNRDLQSVVTDIQKIVNTEIKPTLVIMFNMEDSLKIFKVLKPD
jgi:hypothetical protein